MARITDAGVPGFDVYVERARLTALTDSLAAASLPQVDVDTAEILRIEAGVPVFHRDMDEDTIPLEAGIESRAINMNKGCYVGQEVIVRVLHRGHGRVAKKLAGLTFEGDGVPSRGAVVTHDEHEIGRVTSAVRSEALDRPIALAYLHRDFLQIGTKVSVGAANAVVTALPFVATDSSQPDRSR